MIRNRTFPILRLDRFMHISNVWKFCNAVPTSENSAWITTSKRDSLCPKSNSGQTPDYPESPLKSTSIFKLSGGCCGVRNVTIYQGRYINFSARSTFPLHKTTASGIFHSATDRILSSAEYFL